VTVAGKRGAGRQRGGSAAWRATITQRPRHRPVRITLVPIHAIERNVLMALSAAAISEKSYHQRLPNGQSADGSAPSAGAASRHRPRSSA
jgi:hypothetical protein